MPESLSPRRTALFSSRPCQLVLRSLAAVLGSYLVCWGLIALTVATLHGLAGMAFHDAEQLGFMLGLALFVVTFIWSFAARRLALVWAVLPGGGAAMLALAWLAQHKALS